MHTCLNIWVPEFQVIYLFIFNNFFFKFYKGNELGPLPFPSKLLIIGRIFVFD